MLLSAFRSLYGFAQLPSAFAGSPLGPRVCQRAAGLIFWSAMQALTGIVNSFLAFYSAAHWPPDRRSAVYARRRNRSTTGMRNERGTAVGIFNLDGAGSGHRPAGAGHHAAGLGLADNVCGDWFYPVSWSACAGMWDTVTGGNSPAGGGATLSGQRGGGPTGAGLADGWRCFKRRTTGDDPPASQGELYRLAGCISRGCQVICRRSELSNATKTGWVAAIRFLTALAAVGMWVNGLVVDALARRATIWQNRKRRLSPD